MRYVFFILLTFLGCFPSFAAATCNLDAAMIVGKSPYFNARMRPVEGQSRDGSLAYAHVDDPRVIANFSMAVADPVGSISRGDHVAHLDSYAKSLVNRAERDGRWAQSSVFPFDPVAWRVIEETSVEGVGEATVGHMETRVTPNCILVADFISPASVNLRQRWLQMATEIANLRDTAAPFVVSERWLPEDTTPRGVNAILVGFISPLVVTVAIYILLGNMQRLDPPVFTTRLVLLSATALLLGTLYYQHPWFYEAIPTGKYIDHLLILSFAASAGLIGAVVLGHQTALFGLVASCISGITIITAAIMGWTPDHIVAFAVGASLIFMGGMGIVAWNHSSGASKNAARPIEKPKKSE